MGIPISQFIGSPSAKFENVGAAVKGTILSVDKTQQTDLDTRAPLWWDDEKTRPKEQLQIVLQTALRDTADDDGRRTLYAKGGAKGDPSLGLAMQDAIVAAVQKAGCTSIDEGAELVVQYVGDGPRKSAGKNPAKLYRAKYTAPVRGVALDGFDEPFPNTPAPNLPFATAPAVIRDLDDF